MSPAKNLILILYVADQQRSRDFYAALLGQEPELHVPGMTEFRLSPSTRLGLMPEAGIAELIAPALPDPAAAAGVPRCELYLYVEDPDAEYRRATGLGAKPVRGPAEMGWGDRAAYVADPDGHVLAFARRTAAADP